MTKIIVLGAGMVGSAIAADLSKNYRIKVADINPAKLKKLNKYHNIKTVQTDLLIPENIKKVIQVSDLVVCAVPGFMGFNTIKTIIEESKNLVDISFFSEDPFKLDKLAKKKNVTAIVDCGVAPGLSSIILGYHNKRMNVKSFECYVGGLPKNGKLPYQYKAPFSPVDVIEEYTRPARYIKDRKLVVKPALSDVEIIKFEKAGSLEAFNTDGLRTLIKTMKIPNMIEKTLRYPGHVKNIKLLKDTGFFSEKLIELKNGEKIRPLDLTVKLLFPLWKLKENEKEFTILRVKIEGLKNKKQKMYTYNLYDEFDTSTKKSSMARTTGYTCTAAVNLVAKNIYTKKGISPPEFLGENKTCFDYILSYLKKRNINLEIEEI